MSSKGVEVRVAGPHDAPGIARLLHDFNVEFDTPSPGVEVLTGRLRVLLAGDRTFALVAGSASFDGLALVTLRPNVWFDGAVALLDELVVVPPLRDRGIGSAIVACLVAECRARDVSLIEINVDEPDVDAQRFYRRHGFRDTEPGSTERACYFWQEMD